MTYDFEICSVVIGAGDITVCFGGDDVVRGGAVPPAVEFDSHVFPPDIAFVIHYLPTLRFPPHYYIKVFPSLVRLQLFVGIRNVRA
jgi:hypothetical protein